MAGAMRYTGTYPMVESNKKYKREMKKGMSSRVIRY